MSDLDKFYERMDRLLVNLERLLPSGQPDPDWAGAMAFRWCRQDHTGFIQSIAHPHRITLNSLHGIDEQKQYINQNTRQFVHGFPANNVLLTGARGTGKSSLVKALLNEYARDGLRFIQVEKHHLIDLHYIIEKIYHRPERFILFCDDLSFENDEPGYKALKVELDGSMATISDNVLIYATSNRRHMVPEFMHDNLNTRHSGEEVHPSEAIEEKISLSERFGLWITFYPFNQEQYIEIVCYWLVYFGVGEMTPLVRTKALQWALERGSRSGRVAWQFARDMAGKQRLIYNHKDL